MDGLINLRVAHIQYIVLSINNDEQSFLDW